MAPDSAADAAPETGRGGAHGWLIPLAAGVLLAAIGFNAALAFVNANLFRINGATVTLVQGAIMAAGITLGFLRHAPGWWRWALFLWAAIILWVSLSLFRQTVNLKMVGDAAMVPAFALLGSCLSRKALVRTILVAQTAITLVAMWELADPKGFGDVLNVRDYYVSTRGFDDDSFWSENATLFLSSERPTGRLFLPGSGFHRASSLFLEPVSLGNWVVVVLIMVLALWRSLSVSTRVFLIVTDIILLVACDGRFAILASLTIAALVPLVRFAPRSWPLVYLPGMFVALLIAKAFDLLPSGGDDLPSRLRKGVDYLQQLDLPDLIGFTTSGHLGTADSGWAYLIQTQSIFGLLILWAFTALVLPPRTIEGRRFVNATALFLALCMPISNSFLSIKVIAPLFAIYGFLTALALGSAAADRRAKRRPRASRAERSIGDPLPQG